MQYKKTHITMKLLAFQLTVYVGEKESSEKENLIIFLWFYNKGS